ncbi:MAG: glucokinase [Beijerinckiaceae bacterium]
MFPFPVLLCDLGGTNCRFMAAMEAGREPEALGKIATEDFDTFAEAVRAMRAKHELAPSSLIVCAAGPMRGRSVQLTNAAWFLDGESLARELGLQQGLLLNDFEAQALALPGMRQEWMRKIGGGAAEPGRPQVILGPGTGLGVGALASTGKQYLALASEAGHMNFAPHGEEEIAIWSVLNRGNSRITPETLLSGSGLVRLHRARLAARSGSAGGLPGFQESDAAHITSAALADSASPEAASVRHFWKLVARFSGDMALAAFARGGVTLAGGILPRIAKLLDEVEFRAAFEDKAPMQELMKSIPVRLLMQPDAVLHGMAAIAANPERYALDYETRLWV